jgi:hypothetical protein
MTRRDYLLAELRCASLRARVWCIALKAGWVTPEQAAEILEDCDCLQLIEPKHGKA